jgi:hypothetical protein
MLELGLSGSVRGCSAMGIPTANLGHKPTSAPVLFDHFVRTGEDRLRHGEP